MQPLTSINPAAPIPVPDIDSDAPVAVIPAASVAPLDGPPDGERINTFIVAAKNGDTATGHSAFGGVAGMRSRVSGKPLTYVAAAFALGFVMARVLR